MTVGNKVLVHRTVEGLYVCGRIEGEAGADCNYFEQTVPLIQNATAIINTTPADAIYISDNKTGATGLVSTDDTKVQKSSLIILGTVANSYAGNNNLSGALVTYNEWQAVLDDGSYFDLEPCGQMKNGDWPTPTEGGIHTFAFQFDTSNQITNIDGNIGLTIRNACSEQDSLKTTISAFLKILWKL